MVLLVEWRKALVMQDIDSRAPQLYQSLLSEVRGLPPVGPMFKGVGDKKTVGPVVCITGTTSLRSA